MSRVLIVEDERAIADLLAVNLRHAGHEPRIALAAEQAQAVLAQWLPHVIVLDWMMPGRSGLELARQWRADGRLRNIPILMLTARAAEADKVRGLDSGVDDYLTKPFSMPELLARIRALVRRHTPEATDETESCGALRLDATSHRVSFDGQAITLGPTEYRLLHYFMANPERVHSRSAVLDRVWGDGVAIEERTVDVHVKRLRAALAPWGCGHWIETVRGAGYRFSSAAQQPAAAPGAEAASRASAGQPGER